MNVLFLLVVAVLLLDHPVTPFAITPTSLSLFKPNRSLPIAFQSKTYATLISRRPLPSRSRLLHSSLQVPWTTATTDKNTTAAIESEAIGCVASLVSYQCAEERLGKALTALYNAQLHKNGQATEHPKMTHLVRGRLEDFAVAVPDLNNNNNFQEGEMTSADAENNNNIVDIFLLALASATTGSTSLHTGISTCHYLLNHAGDNEPLQFTPPTRSLVGTIDSMDISLLRDKEDVHRRFSMLFSMDRAKGRKIARLHAEIDDDGTVYIRGLYVQEQHRQKGLSTLMIAVFSHVCHLAFGSYPQTHVMSKPLLCVALMSLGFTATSEQWAVLVAQHDTEKDVTLMSPAREDGPDLGPQFPHVRRRAQKIELVSHPLPPEGSRKIYVLTKFMPPDTTSTTERENLDPVKKRLENSQHQLFSARIVAFLSTLDNAKDPMFRKSRVVRL